MESTDILYSVADGITTITLNKPEKMNAFTRAMGADVVKALDQAAADDAVKVIVLTGAGRAFCAGADLGAPEGAFSKAGNKTEADREAAVGAGGEIDWKNPSTRDFGGYITLKMFDSPKPIIAAINGHAVGIGLTMTLAADIRVASNAAKFGFPFVRRGIAPESASAWFLPRIVGISRALEWTLSGRTFPASEGLEAGLVRSLHEPEDVLPAAYALARDIADNTAPVSVALTRQLLWRMLSADHPMDAHRLESRALFTRARGNDIREGVASFKEKRLPNFADKVSSDLPAFYPWWDEEEY
ncbi:MAG: crotonase/enoyl-CoA hydratase family protein [Caulobacterales bacterium]